MKLKRGVNTKAVQPCIWWALGFADRLHQQLFSRPSVVTSLNDGQHSENSKHYKGEACDLRVKDLAPAEAARFYQFLKMALDPLGFDVVIEGGNPGETMTTFTNGEHVHIEWDFKPGDTPFLEMVD